MVWCDSSRKGPQCRASSGGGAAGWSVSTSTLYIPWRRRSSKALRPFSRGVYGWVFCAKNWLLYTEDAAANDKRFATEIMAAVPVGGLLVFDLGFFSFLWFDDFTHQQKFFVTRMREKIAYRTVQVLSQG